MAALRPRAPKIAEQLDELDDDEDRERLREEERCRSHSASFVTRAAGHALYFAAQPRQTSRRSFTGSTDASR